MKNRWLAILSGLLVSLMGTVVSASEDREKYTLQQGEIMSSTRSRISFNDNWRFHKLENTVSLEALEQLVSDYDAWRQLDLPHDWGIEGDFTRDVPAAEGQRPFPGIGWYRKSFPSPPAGKRVFIEFDGVMRYAEVWLNGEHIGGWPYGYSSFALELTPWLQQNGEENNITVKCENQADSSRWYPGAGIYRNVWLTTVEPVHVAHWGTFVSTPEVSDDAATVNVRTEIQNQLDQSTEVTLETEIVDAQGDVVATASTAGSVAAQGVDPFEQTLKITQPHRWDIQNPYQYMARTKVRVGDKTTDEYCTLFGIRTFRFDAEEGFFLNGRNLKIRGVNLHHGLGPLGTAVNIRAMERQLQIMQGMGCNAIRTAHNPPAPEQLALCDNMGLLVIDETFDEWLEPKVPNGYHVLFRQWAEKDTRALIRRDRNHPSVIMWSIGNEIVGLGRDEGPDTAKFLAEICHDEDPTRPVTLANSAPYEKTKDAVQHVDVIGWNYRPGTGPYDELARLADGLKQIGTEVSAIVSSRGEYLFPVERNVNVHEDGQVSSYDLTNLVFGDLPEDEFKAQEEAPWVGGEFVWSGFDYLGEPEPAEEEETARSTYFGIVDLCGFPKDRYYLYQSHWTEAPMVHILPHWNWLGREGEVTPVFCYTNCASVELFVNGTSQGTKDKFKGVYRLRWDEVTYAPGSIKAVAYDANRKELCSKEIKTAGAPAGIQMTCDRDPIQADGRDLAFITVRIEDEEGNFCPAAGNLVKFSIEGPASIAAVGNGNSMSYEPFQADYRKAFNGLCLLVLRSGDSAGEIVVSATSEGLAPTSLTMTTVQ
jgi:beta-galactosidase